MYSRILIKAAALVSAAVLCGCASNVNPVTGKTIYTPISSTREAYYGAEANKEMLESYGAYTDNAALTAYVDRVGQAVAKGVVRKSVTYTFTILESDDINAYALPGGYVYVTRGALSFASSEAELAGILGHEIGHVDAFHFSSKKNDTIKTLLSVLLRNSSSDETNVSLAEKLAAASAQSSTYSRDQEYEADALGIHYMAAAGYDPQSMVSMLRTEDAKTQLDDELKGNAVAQEIFRLDQSHPQTPDRVARAIEQAKVAVVNPTAGNPAAVNPAAVNPTGGRESYLAAIDGMMFGPDPADGVVEGQQLINSDLGFSFSAPQGFDLWNLHAKAIGMNKRAFMILELLKPPPSGSMADYVRTAMIKDTPVDSVRPIELQGMEAATGVVNGPLFEIRVAAIRDTSDHLYRLAFVAPTEVFHDLDKDFLESIESFRHISADEIAPAPKMKLHVVTVAAGDTVESLAQQMAVKEKKLDWFRALNGLSATDALVPGQKVKLVVAE